jgi:hypothetical protein
MAGRNTIAEDRSGVGIPASAFPTLELTCAACGYGVIVRRPPSACPMCGRRAWEDALWRPFSRRRRPDRLRCRQIRTNSGLIARSASHSFEDGPVRPVSQHAADDFVREVNENIAELGERFGLREETLELICECGGAECAERVEVPANEYERLHAAGRRILATGHADGSAERRAGYAVVDD